MNAFDAARSAPEAQTPDSSKAFSQALPLDAHRHTRFGVWLVLAGFGGFLSWAALAPLDKGVPVSGKVVVAGSRQAVQHPLGGVIERILVRDGDQVIAGQALVQIDATQALAQRQALHVQSLNARANQARLIAERDGLAQIDFSTFDHADGPWADSALALQTQLLGSRRRVLNLELAALRSGIAASQATLEGLDGTLAAIKDQRAALLEQLQGLRELARDGYVARNRLLDNERMLAQLNGSIAETLGNLGVTRRQIEEQRLRIGQRQQEYQRDLRQQLSEQQARAEELAHRLRSADYELTHTRILAPASGTVVGMSVFTNGGVLAPGQQLMEIVPRDTALLIDARAPVELVDKLHPGLPVELMFSAFNQSSTPRVVGELTLVSADRLVDDASQQPYYQIRAKVSDAGLEQLAGLDIRPGMPVQAFVRTGERSLLNYLFKPLADRLHLALVEE
jgi:protease secretion system membrane fusion protein